jgi:hypothetical protein
MTNRKTQKKSSLLKVCHEISVTRWRGHFGIRRGVKEAHIRMDMQRLSNEVGRQKDKTECSSYCFAMPNQRLLISAKLNRASQHKAESNPLRYP